MARFEKSKASIKLSIDYGNGTRVWFNGTRGLMLYDAMLEQDGNLGASYGAMGMYVKAINGVEESAEQLRYWGWWVWTDYGWADGAQHVTNTLLAERNYPMVCSPVNSTTWEMTPPP